MINKNLIHYSDNIYEFILFIKFIYIKHFKITIIKKRKVNKNEN